jgi:hypothetical protein
MARLFNREHQDFNPIALQNLNVGEAYFHGGRLYVDPDTYVFPNRKNPRKQSQLHYGRRREKVEPIITQALLSLIQRRTESQTMKIARPRKPRRIDL